MCSQFFSVLQMYKKRECYDDMLRLVSKFHPDLLVSTHLRLAADLEDMGKFREVGMAPKWACGVSGALKRLLVCVCVC